MSYADGMRQASSGLTTPGVHTGGTATKVEVHNYIDNKEITNGVVKTITKQASRAPTGPSGVDPSMNLIHPGMGSLVPR